jgi:mRNA-degrading endonuclease RelE of RelBE toxin-antitoxin system
LTKRFKVIFKPSAKRGFASLSDGERKAILKKISSLENDPTPPGARELRGFPGFWRLSAKNSRAIYQEPGNGQTILILHVADRSVVYEALGDILGQSER